MLVYGPDDELVTLRVEGGKIAADFTLARELEPGMILGMKRIVAVDSDGESVIVRTEDEWWEPLLSRPRSDAAPVPGAGRKGRQLAQRFGRTESQEALEQFEATTERPFAEDR